MEATKVDHPNTSQPATQDCVTAWYQPCLSQTSDRDIAQEAYLKALEYLGKELQSGDQVQKLLDYKTTIEDVKAIVDMAQERYRSGIKHDSARRWLQGLSERIIYYGQVLDTLAQHHPEYVALAWGSIKFVLTGILNHATLVTQLSKALSKIGDALQESKLSANLYPTDIMRNAIARLYAHIILFLQKAVRWYNMSPAGRAFSSIFAPFELKYKDTVDEIRLCAQTVRETAAMASHAELRDMHLSLQAQSRLSAERDTKLFEMQVQLKNIQEKIDIATSKVLTVATCNKTISENIHVEVLKINPRIHDLQFSNILQILKPEQSPEEVLAKVHSLAKRLQTPSINARDSVDLFKNLGSWISQDESALFLLKVGVRAEAKAKEFAIDIIKLLQRMPCGVVWNLSWVKSYGSCPSMIDMIKGLIFQALRHDPTILHYHPEDLDVTKFHANHEESEWVSLFSHIFSRLSKCFVVVEAEDIFEAHRNSPDWKLRFLALFQDLVDQAENSGRKLKILVIGYNTPRLISQNIQGKSSRLESSIDRPQPVPPHLRRRFAGRSNSHHANWKAMKPRI